MKTTLHWLGKTRSSLFYLTCFLAVPFAVPYALGYLAIRGIYSLVRLVLVSLDRTAKQLQRVVRRS